MPPTPKAQEIARDFCEHEAVVDKLIYIEEIDTFAMFSEEENYYKVYGKIKVFDRELYGHLRKQKLNVNLTTQYVKQIREIVKWETVIRIESTHSGYIGLKDGLINTKTMLAEPFESDKFAFHHLPFTTEHVYSKKEPTMFVEFLRQVLVKKDTRETDEELVVVMQEILGYMLMGSMEEVYAFFFIGDGSNGKSVLMDIMIAMIGDQFCSKLSLEQMTSKDFLTRNLVGKKANICSEEESKYIKPDRFKALTGGDYITADQKFEDAVEFRSYAKMVFASNGLPMFSKIDHGIMRRVVIMPFHRKFETADKKRNLAEIIIEKELGLIVGWAIAGARRLLRNNYQLSNSSEMRLKKLQLEQHISSALHFIEDMCEVKDIPEDKYISGAELYGLYKNWCPKVGRKAMSIQTFGRDIAKVLGKSKLKRVDGKLQRSYNVKLKPVQELW